jgi:hypothetical protein
MDKTVIIPPTNNIRLWLRISALLLLSFFVIALLLVTLLNGGWPNHLLNPVGSYFSMFQLIWPEKPLGALQFIATKSFVVFAHRDPRSELNLWTLEYDLITLAVYVLAALLGGKLISRALQAGSKPSGLLRALLGTTLLVIAVTYMTSIEHCSGPTWVGFVGLYGLGFDGFELYPFYQGVVALLGAGLLAWGLLQQRRAG